MSRRSVMHDFVVCEEFSLMWLIGYDCESIADRVGLADGRAVRRWRKRLGLPARRPGWNNEKRVERADVPVKI